MRTNLTNARNQKDITIAKTAEYLGITERQYRYIETGERGTTEENWLKIFELFDEEISLNKLMENTA